MRHTRSYLSFALVGLAVACGSVPSETSPPPEGREVAPAGILRGNVVYSGPHPCSSDGHIVGAAILFVFDRRNPPPPNGLATTPVNFGVVTGDALFANEPRNTGPSTYCPTADPTALPLTTSAPFTISPMNGGEYVIQAFYDYTGDFLPTFTFRNLPERGDIGGGDIDTADALKPSNASNPNYQPHFLPIDVGTPQPLPAGAPDGSIPNFTIPSSGLVVDNLTVTVGAVLPSPRPYFYPAGLSVSFDPGSGSITTQEVQSSATAPATLAGIKATTEKDPNYDPVLTIPADIAVLAPPNNNMDEPSVNNFESKFPHLYLHGGLPKAEFAAASAQPFHFQLSPTVPAGFTVWQNALFDATAQKWVPQDIPEGGGIPSLWPLVVLSRIDTSTDPSSIKSQGDATHPVVILQGITLLGGDGSDATKPDTLFNTGSAEAFGSLFDPRAGQPTVFSQDHLTVLVRPAALCFNTLFDPNNPDKRGVLVTPHITAMTADLTGATMAPIVPQSALSSPQLAALVSGLPVAGCLPTGRYSVNVVYPDGQAWTVPNESGACASDEGSTDYTKLTCTIQPRPVLRSQGLRAVVEITPATNPQNCGGLPQGPPACQPSL